MRLLAHELEERIGRQRLAHPEALEAVAAAHVEEFELRARAHAFGDDPQPESAREADDRLGDRRILRVRLRGRR